jgi:hypothetical protein
VECREGAHPDIILLPVDDWRLHTRTSTSSFDTTTQAAHSRTTAAKSTIYYTLEDLHTLLLPFYPVVNPDKIHPRRTRWATPAAPTEASQPAISQAEVVVQGDPTRIAFVSHLRKPKLNAASLTSMPPLSSVPDSQILSDHQCFADSLHHSLESGLLTFTSCSAHFSVFTAELANGSAPITNPVGAYKIHAWAGTVVLPSGLLQTIHAPMGCVPAAFILLSSTQRLYFREATPGFDKSRYTEQYVC